MKQIKTRKRNTHREKKRLNKQKGKREERRKENIV